MENLQTRISKLLKENGEYHRELFKRMEEIEKITQKVQSAGIETAQLRAVIKENEKNLQSFHNKAIESSNQNLQRSDTLQRKCYDLEKQVEKQLDEKNLLLDKNREMVDLCKDWENKYG